MKSAILLGALLACAPVPARSADIAEINMSIQKAISPVQTCDRIGAFTMGVAQAYDYATSLRNFSHGAPELSYTAKPFINATHSKPIGLALSMMAWDAAGLLLTRHSHELRCAFELQQTTTNFGSAIHNNKEPHT